jgi:hypothetical protein
MNAKTLEAIKRHGEQLLVIFPHATERDPVALCKKLRRVEVAANRYALAVCNGDIDHPEHEQDLQIATFERRVRTLLGYEVDPNDPIIVNMDPRGYALKIDDEVMRANDYQLHRDGGGYGIIAPDLTEAHNPTRKAR